jgi:signal-transduction protein with cAMP-binding, CBS, and nucleotidyltransferase domain
MYSDYMTRNVEDLADENVIVLDESTCVGVAAREMKNKGVSSLLVGKDNSHVVGIVTEKDILYRVVAENKGPFKATLKEIMSSPLVTIDASATVKNAVTLMRKNAIRRLPVVRKDQVIGILTLRSIIGHDSSRSIDLADVEVPKQVQIMCPYCQSKFENKQELSRHIDRLHVGAGLLEGDMRQW